MRSLNTAWSLFALGLFLFALISFAGVSMTVNAGNSPPPKPTMPKNAGVLQMSR